jgi:hypothetical protein
MKHGELPVAPHTAEDPHLANVSADMTAYLILERELCTCDPDDGLCLCGWDEK